MAVTLERQIMERNLMRPISKELRRQQRAVVREAKEEYPDFEMLWDEFREHMTAALVPPLIDIYDQAAARTTGQVIASKQDLFGDLLTQARRWASVYAVNMVSGITSTTRKIVTGALAAVASNPEMTIGDFRNMIDRAFSAERAKSIAITEATRARFEGTRDTQLELKKLGFVSQLIWLTVNDDRVCPICGPLHGVAEISPGAGIWSSQGIITSQPAHTGCRCDTATEAI